MSSARLAGAGGRGSGVVGRGSWVVGRGSWVGGRGSGVGLAARKIVATGVETEDRPSEAPLCLTRNNIGELCRN